MKRLGKILNTLVIIILAITLLIQSSILNKERAYNIAMAAGYESQTAELTKALQASIKVLNSLKAELLLKAETVPAKETASLSISEAQTPLSEEVVAQSYAPVTAPLVTVSEYATIMLEEINEYRAQNGVAPLSFNNVCIYVADIRATECGALFSHSRPNGEKYYSLYDEGGYTIVSVGENCSKSSGYENDDASTIIEGIMAGYKESPAHNDNMLNPKWKFAGFGFYRADDGTIYGTQEFSSTDIR